MKQTLQFPEKTEELSSPLYVELEPGDATRYRFVVAKMPAGWRGDWAEDEGLLIAVASVAGPLFPGIILPLRMVMDWWKETETDKEASIFHNSINWVIGENEHRVKGGINRWTVRAAFLAVLLEYCDDPERIDRELEEAADRDNYEPPEPDMNADGPAEREHRMDEARRMK